MSTYNDWQSGCHRMLEQSEHAEINRSHYPGTREMCCICDEPTGRAGRGEDSIYVELAVPFGMMSAGEEIGPLCSKCLNEVSPEEMNDE